MNIDLNEIGRCGYKMLRNGGVIPDKDKKDLTFDERSEIISKLQHHISKAYTIPDKDKSNFKSFLYSAVLCYVDNTDLNKYLKMSASAKIAPETAKSE